MPPTGSENAQQQPTEDFIVEWMKKIQPSPPQRWNARSVPPYIFHITTRAEWMKSANIYMPPSSSHSSIIECCDEDRLDGFVSRNYFYKEYAECGVRMDTYFWRAVRKLEEYKDSLLQSLGSRAHACFSHPMVKQDGGESRPRSPYESSDTLAEVTERPELVLLAIGTASLLSDGSLRWDGKNSYPYIARALYKNGDSCSDFRVRYDTGYATLCIPSRAEIEARERVLLASVRSMHSSPTY